MTDCDFGDYKEKLNKVKLDPTRQNLNPDPAEWTFDEQLTHAIADGFKMIEAEENTKTSVKKPESFAQPKEKLQDALGKMSDNPFVKARTKVLQKMAPKARAAIEEMERIGNTCNSTYDTFCKAVTNLGDKLSGTN